MKITVTITFILLFGGAALLPFIQPAEPESTAVIELPNVWILMCLSMLLGIVVGAKIALKKPQK